MKKLPSLKKIYYMLVGFKSRHNYWSCSTFSDWLRTTLFAMEKPGAVSIDEWAAWRLDSEKNNPIVHWITETLLDILQDVVNFPYDVYTNMRNRLRNTFITKTHLIKTGLTRGDWHDSDTRIREGLFTTLVDYVENEATLEHLEWEICLIDSPLQSAAAKEIKELYTWIKEVRPERPDPTVITGWADYCESKKDNVKTDEEKERVRVMLNDMNTMESRYEDEDTEILIRIIKARKTMWT